MTNRFFNTALVAVPVTTIRSQSMLQELERLEQGFDAVATELDTKIDSTAVTFDGAVSFTGSVDASSATTVLVPTVASAGDSSTKAASTAFVQSVLGAAGALLPAQAGHAGKVLKTNGTSYSWEAFTGIGDGGIATVAGGLWSLGSERIIEFSATSGLIVTLPDATTLPVGTNYLIFPPASGFTNGVALAGGELAVGADLTSAIVLFLRNNGTAAGTWDKWDTGAGTKEALSGGVMTAGPEVTIRGSGSTNACIAQITSTTYLVGGAEPTGSGGLSFYVVTAGTNLSLSAGPVRAVASQDAKWHRLIPVTGGFLYVFVTSANVLAAVGLTVAGTTVSSGSVTTLSAAVIYNNEMSVDVAAFGATAVVAYEPSGGSRIDTKAILASGTTLSVGVLATAVAPATWTTAAMKVRLTARSATAFCLTAIYRASGTSTTTLSAQMLSVVTVTITPRTAATLTLTDSATGWPLDAVLYDTSNLAMVYANATTVWVYGVNITDTTVSAIGGGTPYSFSLSSVTNLQLVRAQSTYFGLYYGTASASGLRQLSVSTAGSVVAFSLVGSAAAGFEVTEGKFGVSFDGTYAVTGSKSTGSVRFDSFTAGGPVASLVEMNLTGFYPVNYATRGNPLHFRVTGTKQHIHLYNSGAAALARVTQYGGVA